MLLSSALQVQCWSPSERVRVVNSKRSRTSCKFLACTCYFVVLPMHMRLSLQPMAVCDASQPLGVRRSLKPFAACEDYRRVAALSSCWWAQDADQLTDLSRTHLFSAACMPWHAHASSSPLSIHGMSTVYCCTNSNPVQHCGIDGMA